MSKKLKMFNFKDLSNLHLEITSNCQASCPMCVRNIHGGVVNPNLQITSWSLEDFKQILSSEVLNQIDGFYFCGNFGDPLLNPYLIDMIEYASIQNPNLYIRVHTNGSLRNKKWWKDLAAVMPKYSLVIFALDGLEDTHHIYRIGTDFLKIIENAKTYIDQGKDAEWAYIKFKHNEHQVSAARRLARELGFKNFSVKNSSRWVGTSKFQVYDKQGNVLYYLEPAESTNLQFLKPEMLKHYKEIVASSSIECQSIEKKEIFIDAAKNVYPCCFIGQLASDYQINHIPNEIRLEINNQYLELVQKLGGLDSLNAVKYSIKEILMSEPYQTVYKEYWDKKGLITCARQCGKSNFNFAKSKDQWTESIKLNA